MAYLAVNKDGTEVIFSCHPKRNKTFWHDYNHPDCRVFLPNGSIKKLIGKELTWEDKPVLIT